MSQSGKLCRSLLRVTANRDGQQQMGLLRKDDISPTSTSSGLIESRQQGVLSAQKACTRVVWEGQKESHGTQSQGLKTRIFRVLKSAVRLLQSTDGQRLRASISCTDLARVAGRAICRQVCNDVVSKGAMHAMLSNLVVLQQLAMAPCCIAQHLH